MTFTTGQLAEYVDGLLIGDAFTQCSGATIDSRACEQGNIFFALKGEHTDGHEFIESAITAGCSAVVVQHKINVAVPVIQVRDVRKALYDAATHRRKEFTAIKVLAITGSVGKTTTKNMIARLLGEHVVSSEKSFNNDLGVPLTILAAEKAQYLVAEVGANEIGEIEPLANLVQPDIAVLTSIDNAHLEGFGNKENILSEKVKLLEALPKSGLAIVSEDVDLSGFNIKAPICRVGNSNTADVAIETGLHKDGYGTLQIGSDKVTLSMLGEHNAWNAAFAVVACMHAQSKLTQAEMMALVSKVESPPSRLQRHTIAGITFIDDAYNANPASMRSALELFSSIKGKRKIVVLGDMLELGEHAHCEHRLLGIAIGNIDVDIVILVGPNMKTTSQVISSIHEPDSSEESMSRIAALLQSGDTVLLKGSRGMQLERIIELKRQTKVSSV